MTHDGIALSKKIMCVVRVCAYVNVRARVCACVRVHMCMFVIFVCYVCYIFLALLYSMDKTDNFSIAYVRQGST